jgi:uncharacterized protein YjbI with pentapeptide repeats
MSKITFVRGCRIEPNADLSGANLDNASLVRADLQSANMEGASLASAILRHADLRKANLQKALLWEADLTDARLQGANLSSAGHTRKVGAILRTTTWTGATYSAETILPDGLDPAAAGMVLTS